jgi:Phage integrase family
LESVCRGNSTVGSNPTLSAITRSTTYGDRVAFAGNGENAPGGAEPLSSPSARLARAKRYGRKPFLISKAKNLDSIIETWREQLDKVFEMADVGDERATPHRFRHTFARILLQNGVPVADVADLIGDDEKTVREHYARWVPERQARLTKILKDAFQGQPRPTLSVLAGGRH